MAGLVLVTVIAALALTTPLPERLPRVSATLTLTVPLSARLLMVWAVPRVRVAPEATVISPEITPAPVVMSDPALTVVAPL